jgi:hypothetical protein
MLSTSLRIAARGTSYLALALCQIWSITAGSSEAVGPVGETIVCEWIKVGDTAKTAGIRELSTALRMKLRDRRGMRCFSYVLILFVTRPGRISFARKDGNLPAKTVIRYRKR